MSESQRLEVMMQRFEDWAADKDLCLDQLFMSTDGVPDNPYEDWFTKVLYAAWMAATAVSSNYIADRECEPASVTFFNGRRVFIRDGSLDVDMVVPPEPE